MKGPARNTAQSTFDWSEAIRKMGLQRQKADDEQLAALKKAARELDLSPMTDQHLLDLFAQTTSRSSHDPRQTVVYQKSAKKMRAELLQRLAIKRRSK